MRLVLLTAVAATLVLAPSASADQRIAWEDPCGDAAGRAQAAGQEVVFTTDRSAHHDLRDVAVTALRGGGVDARLRMCGPLPAEGAASSWALQATLDSGCTVSLQLGDYATGERAATWHSWCTRERRRPILKTETYTRWVVDLPASAWEVAGDTVTLRLRRGDLGAIEGAPLTAGTRWSDLRAVAADALYGFGTSGPAFRFDGPGALDFAPTSAPLLTE